MKYLLDTNICIYLIKKNPLTVIRHLETLPIDAVGISSITFAELAYGVEKSQQCEKNKTCLEEFVLPLAIIPFDDQAALHYGMIRAYLEKKGTPIGPLDLMIAAHAQYLKMTLVTNNMKEFKRVPHLMIEDWTK